MSDAVRAVSEPAMFGAVGAIRTDGKLGPLYEVSCRSRLAGPRMATEAVTSKERSIPRPKTLCSFAGSRK